MYHRTMTGSGATKRGASGARTKRRPRGSLDIEDIVTGACELADEVSVAGLSMPVLARHLDVPVTSIYWHFRKKEQLLDAMAGRGCVAGMEITRRPGARPWILYDVDRSCTP